MELKERNPSDTDATESDDQNPLDIKPVELESQTTSAGRSETYKGNLEQEGSVRVDSRVKEESSEVDDEVGEALTVDNGVERTNVAEAHVKEATVTVGREENHGTHLEEKDARKDELTGVKNIEEKETKFEVEDAEELREEDKEEKMVTKLEEEHPMKEELKEGKTGEDEGIKFEEEVYPTEGLIEVDEEGTQLQEADAMREELKIGDEERVKRTKVEDEDAMILESENGEEKEAVKEASGEVKKEATLQDEDEDGPPPGWESLPLPSAAPPSSMPPPPPPFVGQMVCGTCRRLLSYPKGCRHVKCSCCQTVNYVLQEHEVGQVKCGRCTLLLMYPFGAPSVRCTSCCAVTEIGDHNRRPPLSVQQGRAFRPASTAH